MATRGAGALGAGGLARRVIALLACAVVVALAGCDDRSPAANGGAVRGAACAGAGFVGGAERADGRFAARIPQGCADGATRTCVVADGHGPITREILPAGVVADCFAFNQYVGSGLAQIPGYDAGECFGRALLRAPGVPREERPTFRCDGGRAPRGNAGTRAPAPGPAAGAAGRGRIDGRAPDPWGRPPEAGAVGGREAFAPPWAVLVWRDERGRTCVEPGQVVSARTPGRSDQLPGIRPTGRSRLDTLIGSLRYDSRSGTGIQLYGIGRFQPYDPAAGGTCGDPSAGPGLVVGWESRYPRRDQGLAVTAVFGVAGPDVVAVDVAGERIRGVRAERGFVRALRGVIGPDDAPVTVRYRDGRERRLR